MKEKILKVEIKEILLVSIIMTFISMLFLLSEYQLVLSLDDQGIILSDPKNVTNETLQNFPTEDKDLSSGLEHSNESK